MPIKVFGSLCSYRFFAVLALTAALWCGIIGAALRLDFWSVLDLVPAKLFLAGMFLNRLSGLALEIIRRRKTILLSAGILVLLFGILWNLAYRFEGVVSLGEGELFPGYDYVKKGSLARPVAFSLLSAKIRVDSAQPDKKADVELYYDRNSKPVILHTGESARLRSGAVVSILRVDAAPRVDVRDAAGREIHSAFVKLKLLPWGSQDHFVIEKLPYRFYLQSTGKTDRPLRLRLLREKLMLADREIAIGEEISVEGLKISFPEITDWVEVKVRRDPGNLVTLVGAALAGIGAAFAVLRRRKNNVQ